MFAPSLCSSYMVSLKTFEVDIVQARAAAVYRLDGTFFRLFENSPLTEARLSAVVKVVRDCGCVRLLFSILGTVVLVCDRSLEAFDCPVHVEKEVTFKLGDENRELGEDLYTIERHATTINIAQHLYDFVCLSIPMKKVHPQLKADGRARAS